MVNSFPETLYVYECRGPGSPAKEPAGAGYLGIWPEIPFHYLFYDCRAQSSVSSWLLENGDGWSLTNTYQLDYDQWQQISAGGCRVGPFSIRTSTDSDVTDRTEDGIPILLNPGVVFGTGLHETTRGCLLAIADLFEHYLIERVVDLGTGTGILALACAGLGASKVIAVDCNPLAVRVAKNNIMSNQQEMSIQMVVARDLGIFRQASDLLLMNLELPCLRQVLLEKRWLNYRWVIISGFLQSQFADVAALIDNSSKILLEKNLDDWVTLVVEPQLPKP